MVEELDLLLKQRVAQLKGATTVKVIHGSATFWVVLDLKQITAILSRFGELSSRAGGYRWVIYALKRNEHLVDKGRWAIAGTLLWLACSADHPAGREALRRAKEGGHTLAFEITDNAPRWKFRLTVFPSDKRPGAPQRSNAA
jgi:hypothetical protein